jgi:hypothetical protein
MRRGSGQGFSQCDIRHVTWHTTWRTIWRTTGTLGRTEPPVRADFGRLAANRTGRRMPGLGTGGFRNCE